MPLHLPVVGIKSYDFHLETFFFTSERFPSSSIFRRSSVECFPSSGMLVLACEEGLVECFSDFVDSLSPLSFANIFVSDSLSAVGLPPDSMVLFFAFQMLKSV